MKIACLLGPGFEDSEFQKPYDELKKAGHAVTVISTDAGLELHGYKGKVTFTSEKGIKEVSSGEYDALLIPGGQSPDKLRVNPDVVRFVTEMIDANKPVLAICHGPQLILTADRHKKAKMTAWQTIQDDLRKAGANVVDEEVVVDKNIVTSRKPDDIPAFIEQSLKLLGSKVHA